MFDINDYQYGYLPDAAREKFLLAQADRRLKELGASGYCLGDFDDDCLCLENQAGIWVIYYAERGEKNFVAALNSLTKALDYLAVATLGRYPLGLDWPALYAQPL